jgi:hypothetical protein
MPMNPRLLRPTTSLHPDAGDWANRVRANGGTVSGSTLNAVTKFCRDIDAAGIRDRFYRLNLFCGNSNASLNAVRTPLYRGTSRTGTQYGNALDTNNNFVQSDYNETGASGGLIGNGVTKYLDTGLATDALPQVATGHLSFWTRGGAVTATKRVMGVLTSSPSTQRYFMDRRTIAGGGDLGSWGGSPTTAITNPNSDDTTAGLFLVTRTGATSLTGYKNTTAGGNNTSSVTPAAFSASIPVFAGNNGGVVGDFYEHRLAAYSIGDGLTGGQVTSFYNALNTFMQALSRT